MPQRVLRRSQVKLVFKKNVEARGHQGYEARKISFSKPKFNKLPSLGVFYFLMGFWREYCGILC